MSGLQQVTTETWEQEVLQHSGRVLVDFYADWCWPCRALSPHVERLAADHPDVKFVKLDTDADEPLSDSYGVRTIPTLIAFEAGKEVGRAINPQSRAILEGLLTKQAGE
jgi:thioredoxin 1